MALTGRLRAKPIAQLQPLLLGPAIGVGVGQTRGGDLRVADPCGSRVRPICGRRGNWRDRTGFMSEVGEPITPDACKSFYARTAG